MKPALGSHPLSPATPLDAVLPTPAAAPAREPEPEPSTATTRRPARGASLKHRIGTMRAPYERSDGARVRQWSLTMPVDVIQDITILATKSDKRPAELVLEVLRRHIARAREK